MGRRSECKVGKAIGLARRYTGEERRWIETLQLVLRCHWDIVKGDASARYESRESRGLCWRNGATGEEREENRRALESEGGTRWS